VLVLLATSAAACAKLQARTEPEMPTLSPPPPPPRVVERYVEELPAVAEAPPAEYPAPITTATRAAPKPPAPRAVEPTPKPEPPPVEPERPAAAPPPSLTLKPAPGAESPSQESVRTLLNRAAKDLSRVNYGTLKQDGKTQYDTAKRFMQQAEEALRGGNLIFAGTLADKAATMASVLVR
jgi:outer membrane biosynthesis protein TonB